MAKKPKSPHHTNHMLNDDVVNGRDQEIIMEMKKQKIVICGISETTKKGQRTSKYGEFTLIYSGVEKSERVTSSVGILLHNKHTPTRHNLVKHLNTQR